MNKKQRSEFAKLLGAIGGKNRAKNHGKTQLSEWAKKGGRPVGSKDSKPRKARKGKAK